MTRGRVAPAPLRPYTDAQLVAMGARMWLARNQVLADGAAVASVADAGTNAMTETQATPAKQFTFKTSLVNGKPGFQGSATNLTAMASAAVAAMSGAYTLLAFGKTPTTTPSANQYLSGGPTSGNRFDIFYTASRTFGLQCASGLTNPTTVPADTPFVTVGVKNGASSVVYVDGIPTTGDTGSSSPTQLLLGARNGQIGSFDGGVAGWVLIPGALTSSQIRRLSLWAANIIAHRLTPAGVLYVDGDNGSDTGNTGRSYDRPLKTISKANTIAGTAACRIQVRGTLREQVGFTGTNGPRLVVYEAGAQHYASELHTGGWTSLGGGVYSKAVTGYDTSLTHARNFTDTTTLVHPETGVHEIHPKIFQAAGTPTAPAQQEIGGTPSVANGPITTLYIRLAGDADPNTKNIEVPKYAYALFSSTANDVVVRGGTILCANRGNVQAGSALTDGRITCIEVTSMYAGTNGNFATQNDATAMYLYRCKGRGAINDNANIHGTAGRHVYVYIEDPDFAFAGDENVSYHDDTTGDVVGKLGGLLCGGIGGGGMTNVGNSVVTITGNLIISGNRSAGPSTAKEGGISAYDTTTVIHIGPGVVVRNNIGPGYYTPAAQGCSVDPSVVSTGNALADVA